MSASINKSDFRFWWLLLIRRTSTRALVFIIRITWILNQLRVEEGKVSLPNICSIWFPFFPFSWLNIATHIFVTSEQDFFIIQINGKPLCYLISTLVANTLLLFTVSKAWFNPALLTCNDEIPSYCFKRKL